MIVTGKGGCAHHVHFSKCYNLVWKEKNERKSNMKEYVEEINPDIGTFVQVI